MFPGSVPFERLATLLDDENAQGMVEYALILSLIALGVIGLLTQLGNKTNTTFSTATFSLP